MKDEMQMMIQGVKDVKIVNVTAWFKFDKWVDLDITARQNPKIDFITNSRDQLYGTVSLDRGNDRHGKILIVKSGMYFTGRLPPSEVRKEMEELFNSIKWTFVKDKIGVHQ
jgi:hypothetical protein